VRARARTRPAALLFALVLVPAAAGAGEEALSAGAVTLRLPVPPGTPLAGYGSLARRLLIPDVLSRHPHAFWFRPHRGELDPLGARALVVQASGARLAWVAMDLIAVDQAFTARVARRLREAGVPPVALLRSASHTHSGPGAFLDFGLLNVVAADREEAAVRDALVEAVAEAIRRADAARVPARVGTGTGTVVGLTRGRFGQPVDPEVVVVKLVGERGAPLAALWNYAIHGTMLGPQNLRLSGDVMGAVSRRLERELGVPMLFVNGAVGDVSPAAHGLAQLEPVAETLSRTVREIWDRVEPHRRGPLVIRSARVTLGAPSVSVRNCLGRWVPRWVRLPLGRFLPREAELVAGVLGDVAWITVPGELQASLGRMLKGVPGRRAIVAGLSNDYLGYLLTAIDYQRVAYVTCASLYGPEGGARLTEAGARLLRAVSEHSR
jgi:neutral ceramidase